jgi:CDP-paratose synthetase
MQKKILLTGATGYLGSHLAIALNAKGYHLIILKRQASQLKKIESIKSAVDLYDVENLDYNKIFNEHANIEAIIHTATCYGRNNESIGEIFSANTSYPLQLMDAGSRAGVKLFLNTDTILDKYLNLYSFSKNQLLEWGRFFSINKKIKFGNIKLEHFYGAFDDSHKFATHIIRECINNKLYLNLTPGQQTRDFIHINDVVSAYITLLQNAHHISEPFFELDVGSGTALPIREFVEKIHFITKSKTKLNFGAIPYRDGEVMHSEANIGFLKKLGWQCQYDINTGLNDVINKEKTI